MKKFTNCTHHEEINTVGNLINKDTNWNNSGTLIKNLEISSQEINCASRLNWINHKNMIIAIINKIRTLVLPIRYRTIEDAMGICEALGETGDFLKPFENYEEWLNFRNIYINNPAIEKYCDHGGRYMLWLPYQVINSIMKNFKNHFKGLGWYKWWSSECHLLQIISTIAHEWCMEKKQSQKHKQTILCDCKIWYKKNNSNPFIFYESKAMRQTRVGLTMTVTSGKVFMAGTEHPALPALSPIMSPRILSSGNKIWSTKI